MRQGKTWQLAAEILQKAKYLLEEFQMANFKLACHETSDTYIDSGYPQPSLGRRLIMMGYFF